MPARAYPMRLARRLLELHEQGDFPPRVLTETYGIDVHTVRRMLGRACEERTERESPMMTKARTRIVEDAIVYATTLDVFGSMGTDTETMAQRVVDDLAYRQCANRDERVHFVAWAIELLREHGR